MKRYSSALLLAFVTILINRGVYGTSTLLVSFFYAPVGAADPLDIGVIGPLVSVARGTAFGLAPVFWTDAVFSASSGFLARGKA